MAAKLTKIDIINGLSEKYAGRYHLKITAVRRFVEGTLDAIVGALIRGEIVELRNFGVFVVVLRKSRKARNPRKNYEVIIPERKVVKFKPGRIMEQEITQASMGRKKPDGDAKP